LDVIRLILSIPGLVLGLSFHEFAHAWVADRFGDPTPRNQGRLTLDPRAHWDWFGALIFLLSGGQFAWARPVQVNVWRLRPRYAGELAVALAGIAMNTLLAIVLLIGSELLDPVLPAGPGGAGRFLVQAVRYAGFINLGLAVFNFLPVPPLDGWRFFSRLVPGFSRSRIAFYLDQYGMFFLMLLLILDRSGQIVRLLLTPFIWLIGGIVNGVVGLVLDLVG